MLVSTCSIGKITYLTAAAAEVVIATSSVRLSVYLYRAALRSFDTIMKLHSYGNCQRQLDALRRFEQCLKMSADCSAAQFIIGLQLNQDLCSQISKIAKSGDN